MPVVINEFETVVEPAPQPTAQPAGAAPAPQPPTPEEIAALVRQQLERAARVWAH